MGGAMGVTEEKPPVLTDEQWAQLREAVARGEEAEQQFRDGEAVTVRLSSFKRAGDDMRLSAAEKRTLDELRAIRSALAGVSEETRALLVDQRQSPNRWLDRVDECIGVFDTASDFSLIGDELVSAGKLSQEQAIKKDFSPAGHPHPYGRYEAVVFLTEIWKRHFKLKPETKVPRGAYLNKSKGSTNYYRFNGFVTFLGEHLMKVDRNYKADHIEALALQEGEPTSKRTDLEAACYYAWLTLGKLYE